MFLRKFSGIGLEIFHYNYNYSIMPINFIVKVMYKFATYIIIELINHHLCVFLQKGAEHTCTISGDVLLMWILWFRYLHHQKRELHDGQYNIIYVKFLKPISAGARF